jgi:putative acetyltransferase
MVEIREVESGKKLEEIRELFREYTDWLGFDLGFQDFETEFSNLPGGYSLPDGSLLLAQCEGKSAGCGALRRLDRETCEMKRLYVRPQYRRRGIGRRLAVALIDRARGAGYVRMRLDTVPWMTEAIALYESLGFVDTAPYRHNPVPGARFMELVL